MISHFDGRKWGIDGLDYPYSLRAVAGTSENDVFVVGDRGAIFHFDGAQWSPMNSGTTLWFYSVHAISSRDVHAVGGGVLAHFDGTKWNLDTQFFTQRVHDVWCRSTNDVFAVGENGAIMHYDGSRWAMMESHASEYLYSVEGGPDGVYVISARGSILRYDGVEWSLLYQGHLEDVYSAWGNSSNSLFVSTRTGLRHFDGTSWTEISTDATEVMYGLWGGGERGVYAVGVAGTVIHSADGVSWSVLTTWFNGPVRDIFSPEGGRVRLFGTSEGGFDGSMYRYEDSVWVNLNVSGRTFTAGWGSSTNDIFVTGFGGISHYDGATWTTHNFRPEYYVQDVWGASPSDVFAVGTFGAVLHFNGAEWRPMESQTTDELTAVWGSSDTNVFAVSNSGRIHRYNGVQWAVVRSHYGRLRSVWGCADSCVFAVSNVGHVLQYDGTTWTDLRISADLIFYSVCGSSSTDVYAVGRMRAPLVEGLAPSVVYHYDGDAWTEVDAPNMGVIQVVYCKSANEVIMGGESGIVARYHPE